MKFCESHWQQLRKAIADRGLSHLVSKDGETAVQSLLDEGDPTAKKDSYDPLMSATMMIYGRAIEIGGLYLMTQKPDGGEYCPLCELNAHAPDAPPGIVPSDEWVAGCTDAILNHCRTLGLVQGVQ